MMDKREIKEDCYFEMLDETIVQVESILNQISKIKNHDGFFEQNIIDRDLQRSYFELELSLANLSILLRKMVENKFITIDDAIRRDINSIIHSNKFEYYDIETIYVYSKMGKEEVSIKQLLNFSKHIIKH